MPFILQVAGVFVGPFLTLPMNTNRRQFLRSSSTLLALPWLEELSAAANPAPSRSHEPMLVFNCDFNWARYTKSKEHPEGLQRPATPEDWAQVDAREYFKYHVEFGNNVTYCQAWCSYGFALYPSKLGPTGKGKAATLFPDLYRLSREAGLPVWSYISSSSDFYAAQEHPEWLIPGTIPKSYGHGGFMGPETPYVDVVCRRIEEFLRQWPVDWLLLDWFTYGPLVPNGGPVQPTEFVKKPFHRIIGRPMPEKAEDITMAENLLYKRTVLAEQFRKLHAAVKGASPKTKVIFNVPYHRPAEELWVDHPMLKESDGLFAESSDDVVGWLLDVRRPDQRVMTTVIGRGKGLSRPDTWKKWHDRGCDFFGYAHGTPPGFLPVPEFDEDLTATRKAFQQMNPKL